MRAGNQVCHLAGGCFQDWVEPDPGKLEGVRRQWLPSRPLESSRALAEVGSLLWRLALLVHDSV